MLMDTYCGWLIKVIPNPEGYSFHCTSSDQEAWCDRGIYQSPRLAQAAARRFVQAAVIRTALRHCYSSYCVGGLSPEEYVTLEELILSALNLETAGLESLGLESLSLECS
ncbi:hypothetical protein [Alkalinema sp. FACHB-956]|uniref:hypothetical protein n=1 Tax=Alkalinema sp. FACHB-956 TaxID=2692768 RepID=UPI001688B22F|nr:hypothetical protein [Alkalinema sp. FACHB-956]MBD2329053.1 hypothetical protein [Alkalinema sp. FACHB-956]